MKILLVITKAEIGGAQAFVLTLAGGLKKVGFDICVASGEGDYLPRELEKLNITFFRLKNLKKSINPIFTIAYILELKALINREGFDIVHFNSTNSLPGIFAIKLSKIKIKTIFTVHGLSVLDTQYKALKLIKILFKKYFKFFINYIDKVVFVSKYNLEKAVNQGITTNGIVIYNGIKVDTDYFLNKENAREELSKLFNDSLSNAYLIGSIGRFAEQKNYEFILNNWKDVKKRKPNAKLIIIGDGPERCKYETIIKELNISADIRIPGEIENASFLLKGFDLFVLPSIYEGLSISLIEALFSNIPILASDVGGNKEIIGNENCYLLNNKIEFFEKLNKNFIIHTDKSLFSAKSMVDKYINIYE